MIRTLSVIALAFVLATSVQAKDRDWQIGKVLDVNQGTGENLYRAEYVIEFGTYVYVSQQHLRGRRPRPADVIVNGSVKIAIENKKLFLVGEDGKEHQTEIVKRILKEKK